MWHAPRQVSSNVAGSHRPSDCTAPWNNSPASFSASAPQGHTMVRQRFGAIALTVDTLDSACRTAAVFLTKRQSLLKRGAHLSHMMQANEPVRLCRGRKCGIASRRDSSIGGNSGLLQGYDICLLFPKSFLQFCQHASPLEPHVHIGAKKFKSQGSEISFMSSSQHQPLAGQRKLSVACSDSFPANFQPPQSGTMFAQVQHRSAGRATAIASNESRRLQNQGEQLINSDNPGHSGIGWVRAASSARVSVTQFVPRMIRVSFDVHDFS